MLIRDLLTPSRLVENGDAFDIVRIFREAAWDAFCNNCDENESELQDYVDDYEDETGETVQPKPGHEMVRSGELTDPKFEAWCRAQVEDKAASYAASLRNLIRGGAIIGWRAVEAPKDWDPRSAHVGVHWSFTKEKAQPIFGGQEPGHWLFVIKAKLPVSSIDWYFTTKALLSEEFGEDEDEIRLLDDAPYQIISFTKKPIHQANKINMTESADDLKAWKGWIKADGTIVMFEPQHTHVDWLDHGDNMPAQIPPYEEEDEDRLDRLFADKLREGWIRTGLDVWPGGSEFFAGFSEKLVSRTALTKLKGEIAAHPAHRYSFDYGEEHPVFETASEAKRLVASLIRMRTKTHREEPSC